MDAERSTLRLPEDGEAIAARARAALVRMDEALAMLRQQRALGASVRPDAAALADRPSHERR